MLVMRRRAGESVLLGGDIEIQVLHVGPSRVKLGIVAPESVSIMRREVQITKVENETAASSVTPESIRSLLGTLHTSLPQPVRVKTLTGE